MTHSGVHVIDASPKDELEKNNKTPRQAVGAADRVLYLPEIHI